MPKARFVEPANSTSLYSDDITTTSQWSVDEGFLLHQEQPCPCNEQMNEQKGDVVREGPAAPHPQQVPTRAAYELQDGNDKHKNAVPPRVACKGKHDYAQGTHLQHKDEPRIREGTNGKGFCGKRKHRAEQSRVHKQHPAARQRQEEIEGADNSQPPLYIQHGNGILVVQESHSPVFRGIFSVQYRIKSLLIQCIVYCEAGDLSSLHSPIQGMTSRAGRNSIGQPGLPSLVSQAPHISNFTDLPINETTP
jgi:hypothetical protein